MIFFQRSFVIFEIFFFMLQDIFNMNILVSATPHQTLSRIVDLPNIIFIQYWNQTKPIIYSQHEIFLEKIDQWNQHEHENYEQEIKWYVYGLILLYGDNNENQQNLIHTMKKSMTIDDAIRFHSSDVLMIGIKLNHLGTKLFKFKFYNEAIFIYEICHHILSLGQEGDDLRSFQLNILMKLGDLYSSLQRHNHTISTYTNAASVLHEANRYHSILAAQVSLKGAAALCESSLPSEAIKTDCLMAKKYVNATLANPMDLAYVLKISARVNLAHKNYGVAELELRECLKILSSQCHMNETNPEYLSLSLNLANTYFAQSKWFHGSVTLEKYLRSYSQTFHSPQEKAYLFRLIKRTIGGYLRASQEFYNAHKFQESKVSKESAVKMTSDWQTWLLQFKSSDHMSCYEKNFSTIVPPNPISKNLMKTPMKNQSDDPMIYKRHVLDTLVFWTVVLILVSSGLYSVSDLSHAVNTIPTPTIHSTLPFKPT